MVKRRSDAIQDASPSSKRARTDDTSDYDQNPPRTQTRARNNGKGKARAAESSEDEDEEMGDQADEIDDEKFEEEFEDAISKAVQGKRNVVGGIAEHGIIESIEMHQFMCHKYLSFQFGPQINFIIGHNGSGKSAVLSAITIALGGKSNATGRGSGLKSFIREGQGASEITITLKNQGEEAFKPNEYGKSISITRRFTKEGSSTWKIKGSKSSHIISSKKEELAAICDHMNIQVDNPMNVLTQDAARQFLSASAPADKYKFFLRGTQLSQLSAEYETCIENITNTMNVLKHKQDAIPDLRQALNEAKAKYQEASKALEQQAKARDLKTELAWAHVRVKEKELESKVEAVERSKRQLEKIRDGIKQAQEKLDEENENVRKFEEESNDLGEIDELHAERAALKDKMKEHRKLITKCNSDLRDIQTSIRALDQSILEMDQTIDAETARMASDTKAKREKFQRRMNEATATVSQLEEQIRSFATQKADAQHRAAATEQEGMQKEKEMKDLRDNISAIQANISALQRTENNKYAAYGTGMAHVIAQLPKMRWAGDVPLGPLGIYVKVKNPDAWADLLAQQLSAQLTAFAITDARDRDQLKRLMESKNVRGNQIIIYEKDLFDYSQGEPAPDVLTVLRAMQIDDPYVERILINQRTIERFMLAPSRRAAEDVLRRVGGGNAWTQDLFNVRRFPEGGGSTNPIDKPSRSQMLRNEDTATRQKHLESELRELEAQYNPLQQEVTRLRAAFSATKQEINQISQNDRKAHSNLSRAKQEVNALQQEANEDTPVNLAGLQDAKAESEQEKAGMLTQFEAISRTKAEEDDALRKLQEKDDELKAQVHSFNERKSEMTDRVTSAAQARMKAQGAVRHYQGKENEAKTHLEAAEEEVTVTEKDFEEWTQSATTIGERVETNRKPEDVQRQMESVKSALKEREKRQGATVEEVVLELNTAKERLDRAQKDFKQMVALNKILRKSLTTRLARWQEFRRHIALRCKMVFRYNLSQRGYFGNILFNHHEQTLTLKVQTDDQLATQDGSKEKDPRSLSGGEKSFSTICLLLSLWESIGCPLRCLDEFDVFMDAVNRRISMKMMIDTANQSDKKQYVLITPQDMNNIRIGPTVRVHRMTDPERGQGVLAMS